MTAHQGYSIGHSMNGMAGLQILEMNALRVLPLEGVDSCH
jgi:hypothetical protein